VSAQFAQVAALPPWAWLTAAVLAAGLLTGLGYVLGRRGRRVLTTPGTTTAVQGRWVETLLTLAAAGIATAVAISGMWRVFGDVLGFTGPGRIALAGFLEIALMVSAIRARRALREHGSVGVDGAAVWVMAALSAVLAAADAEGLARAVRFAAPLVAAWLWERGLAAERRAAAGPRARIAWRWTSARLAVRLGLADPAARAVDDVDRARRLARLTRARIRLAVLETSRLPRPLAVLTGQPLRIGYATWRLQRHALAAVEHLHLGLDPTVAVTIRTTVAAVTGLRDATAPEALAAASPWARPALPEAGPGVHLTGHGRPAGHAPSGHPAGHAPSGHTPAPPIGHEHSEHEHAVPSAPGDTGHSALLNGHARTAASTGHEQAPSSTGHGHASASPRCASPVPAPDAGDATGHSTSTSAHPNGHPASTPVPTIPDTPWISGLLPFDEADRNGTLPGRGTAPVDDRTPVDEPGLSRPSDDDHELAAAIVAGGSLPSVRAIKAAYRVGNARAARLRLLAQEQLSPSAPAARPSSTAAPALATSSPTAVESAH